MSMQLPLARRVLLLVTLLSARRAAATEPGVDLAEQAFASLDYLKAIETAKRVVQRGHNEPDALRRAYALLGQASAITGEEEQAKRYFRTLLALQPDFRLAASASPKVRKPLTEALAEWAGRPGLTIGHRPPTEARHDDPLRLRVLLVEDPLAMVAAVAVKWKLPRESSWSTVRAEGPRRDYALSVPLSAVGESPGTLSYYIEILDEKDNVLMRRGAPGEPFVLPLTAERARTPQSDSSPRPWYKRWWVWTVAGVLVAGATTAVVVSTARPDSTQVELGWEVKGAQP